MPKLFLKLTSFLILLYLITIPVVFAEVIGDNPPSDDTKTITIENPLGEDATIQTLLDNIIDFLAYKLGPLIAVAVILYAAFLMITSAGNEEKFALGRRALFYAIIGYMILLLADGLIFVIKDVLLGSPSADINTNANP